MTFNNNKSYPNKQSSYNVNNNYGNKSFNNKINSQNFKVHFNENDVIIGEGGKDYVDLAKEIINNINKEKLTTSKIRNILSMLSEIYKLIVVSGEKELSVDNQNQLQYFKIRCLYEAGREEAVKDLIDNSNAVNLIKEIGNNKKRFVNYYHYFEALVSWHRYLGGKDN